MSPVSDLDLEQIKNRADKASAGPWTAHPDGLVWAPRLGDPVSRSELAEDAVFIAHARTDLPRLVAEVERLQRLLAEPFPTSDGYEQMAAALTDMRGLVVEILRYFYDLGHPGQAAYRSTWVPVDTLARWRQIVGETGV